MGKPVQHKKEKVESRLLDGNIRLSNKENVRFSELLNICIEHFGKPRVCGSHHIFKMPWAGNPRINIQKDGKNAKPYQVRQVKEALEKLNELKGGAK
ncbi:MAG: hypothetical protein LBC85_00270 [Fibromonadaceae bacterium]|jgi:hypothetical protein|nr:hypothetical protein [Fibromonadaceae bacterium]